jgi:Transposase DDE domain
MPHQDSDGLTPPPRQLQDLKRALDWLTGPAPLAGVAFRGDCSWTPLALTYAALLWAWSDERALTQRFALARKAVALMAILPRPPAATYQAFLKLLRTRTAVLAAALTAALRDRMGAELAGRRSVAGFDVFGADGSRLGLPRTRSNEGRFAAASVPRRGAARRRARSRAARDRRARAKKADTPQMWVTTLFHVGTGLPWGWRLGPSDSSERGHLREMVGELPAGALVTADAGFVGYETWRAILDGGRHLLIRVGANVRLLKGLGYARQRDGLVSLWPDREAARGEPPLVLRLVVARGGRHPVYLVTSVLDAAALTDRQVAEVYALRWGVELFYRHLKQTYERRKLRSHTAGHAELEATWSLLGLWAMCLHAEVELSRSGVPADRVSVAGVLLAYRRSLREYKSDPCPGESLAELVGRAVIDSYVRKDKASRDYPRKKYEASPGAPKVRRATRDQINAAKQIRDQKTLGLTA